MVDYSRWNRIEISDDEDETHPNIDTGSLFRWRHQARMERMQRQREERENLEQRIRDVQQKIDRFDQDHVSGDDRQKLLDEKHKLDKEKAQMDHREQLQPWNVDTISHDSWSKTLVNRKCLDDSQSTSVDNEEEDEISDEKVNQYSEFINKNEPSIRKFAFYSRFEDSGQYLLANSHLACQHSLDYLMLWCMEMKLDQKDELLDHVARQSVLLQMILNLAKTVGRNGTDPRDCLPGFFTKAKQNWQKFHQLWMDELKEFHKRIETAAKMRLDRAVKEQLESGDKVIGPGGLDAQEVFESLPTELQKCFEKRDVQMLQDCLEKMDPVEAERHMQRCIDAGLWETKEQRTLDEDEQFWMEVQKTMKEKPEEMENQYDDDSDDG